MDTFYTKRKNCARHKFPFHLNAMVSVPVLMMAGVLACSGAQAQNVVIPRVPVAAGTTKATGNPNLPNGVPNSSGTNLVSGTTAANPIYTPSLISCNLCTYTVAGNTATINEGSNTSGILGWSSFNVGAGSTVNFVQPTTTSVLLNRVDGALTVSMINGAINANGMVYFYNPNGILFGRNSIVNVNTLVATSLDINNNSFLQGIASPSTSPIFFADPNFAGVPGPVINDGTLNAATNGKVMLFAPNVTNNGMVTAPDGQVIMAAGGMVYLQNPVSTTDFSLRGLYVEVDSSNLPAGTTTSATNSGFITVGRGNASLVGLAVNQNGMISAQTSVSLNGSVYLKAEGNSTAPASTITQATPTTGGTLTLGSGSVTQINIVDDGNTITQGQTNSFIPSQVTMTGQNIVVQNNARITAPGGNVTMTAVANPTVAATAPNTSSITLDPGSVIDVSGYTGQTMAMSSNVISVQLLAELADNLVLRDSSLRGQTLNFDIRQGTNIADISADLAKVPMLVGQIAAKGGTVSMTSEGSIVQDPGSKINVSGGFITYLPGYVNTSFLSSGGALFNDGTALADKTYNGVVNLPNGRWDYEPGYIDGQNAGTVEFNAPSIVMQGTLVGTATNGTYQRDAGASNRAEGGQLIINTVLDSGSQGNNISASNLTYNDQIVLDNAGTMPAATSVSAALASNRIDVDVDALKAGGFTRLNLTNEGEIDVAGPISLGAGGNITLTAIDNQSSAYGNINFYGNVTIPGGTLNATAANTLTVSSGVQLGMGGLWTNDSAAGHPLRDANGEPTGDIITQGGNIELSANRVVIDDDVSMDVSGGVWLNKKNKLTKGDGGDISIVAADLTSTQQTDQTISLIEIGKDLSLTSYSMAQGGTLSLTTNNIYVGGYYAPVPDVNESTFYKHSASATSASQNLAEQYLWLPVGFFQQGGFTNYDLTAYSNFYVNPGSQITPLASNWIFKSFDSYRTVASGVMSSVAEPGLLNLVGPQGGRSPVNLTFSAVNTASDANLTGSDGFLTTGTLTFGDNAKITTDPGASVTLLAGQLLSFDGTIDAPAGNITLGLAVGEGIYSDQRSIWMGGDAHLWAQGTTSMLYTGADGITSGSVLGGGQINIGGIAGADDQGYLVVAQQDALSQLAGATFDVSGVVSAPVVLDTARSRGAPAAVASAGGNIDIEMREGILFGGTLLGNAGNSSQQGGTLSITLEQGQPNLTNGFPDSAPDLFNIVGGAANGNVPAGFAAGDHIGNGTNALADQAWISTGSFENGGFSRLYFKSQDAIELSSASASMTLAAPASLYLDAPTIQVASTPGSATPLTNVQINSAYVQVGSDDYEFQNKPTTNSGTYNAANTLPLTYVNDSSTGGVATLNVNATTIDLAGTTVVQGVNTTNLNAVQDIRLVGISQVAGGSNGATLAQILPTGEFSVTGTLNLTASQVYPITLSTYALNAEGTNSALNFMASGYKGQAPLAAGGTLYGYAQNINQSGVVLSPFGTIDFQAGNSLTYTKGSTTSVAGTGVVPFGLVQNGTAWVYDFGGGDDVEISLNPTTTGTYPEMALPTKQIISRAPNINTETGATLNLSGGGSLYAYEFTPGSYGTVDVLSNTTSTGAPSNVYAINPNYTAAVAPRDYQYGDGSNLQPGQSVYLSGIAGLPAGNYLLLPAHYALLPGGMSITLSPNSTNMPSVDNVVNLNGSVTVSGRANLLGLGTSVDSGYVVTPGNIVRAESQFTEYSATSFFTAAATAAGVVAPQLPNDGGYLEFDAANTLALSGQFLLNPDTGGRRGTADISAPDIYVVASDSQAVPANALVLTAAELNSIDADSLMLGGVRQVGSNGTNVAVGAQNIMVENNSSSALTGPEIILAAQDNITIASGAVINASGKLSQTPSDLTILATDPNGNNVGTGGALLIASAGAPVTVTRQSPGLSQGTLNIEQGAVVSASGSAYLDGTLTAQNNGHLNLSTGATLSVSSSSISLGNAIPSNVGGFQFSNTELASLGTLAALNLNSYTTINMYGAVNLGSTTMQNLTLDASGILGSGSGQTAMLTAQNVNFGGGSQTVTNAPVAGTFNVVAQNINFGTGGNFAINGYANTKLTAGNTIAAAGAGTFSAQNNLTLAANNIVADSLSNVTIQAGAALNLTSNSASPAATQQMGGSLAFVGNTILSSANITAQAGQIALSAQNGVQITGGTINASGASEVFGTTTAYAPAGSIALNSTNGAVIVDVPATLNVSAVGASAGTLTVTATGNNGVAQLNGTMLGNATTAPGGTTPTQGSFVMQVAQLTSDAQFDQINNKLNQGGFSESRSFNVLNGNIVQNAGSTLTASNVTIATDNGNVTIGGTINASGAQGGNIQIYAQQAQAGGGYGNVTLQSGSNLNASATTAATSTAGTTGTGGNVVIGTGSADGLMQTTVNGGSDITFAAGANINVSGMGLGASGSVDFRAPRIGTEINGTDPGTDVAITSLTGTIKGSTGSNVIIEANKVYTTAEISNNATVSNGDGTYSNIQVANASGSPQGTLLYSEAQSFTSASNIAAIQARLGTVATIETGIEIRSPGDLLVSVNEGSTAIQNRGWNLDTWRFNNSSNAAQPESSPIVLTLRAAGNLNIAGSISDGFVKPTGSGAAAKVSMPDWQLDSSASSSFRLAGGADLTAANPLAVIANSQGGGNVNINFAAAAIASETATNAPVAMVRTGTGSISVAAGGNVVLGQTPDPANSGQLLGAVIYTAGMQATNTTPGAFTAPKDQLNKEYGAPNTDLTAAQFAVDGGAISVMATGSVIGAPTSQLVDNWLFRQGETTTDAAGNTVFSVIKKGNTSTVANTAWWTRPDYFDQGIATMAGGDVSVVAVTGNLQDVSASVATNAYMSGSAPTVLAENGGGNLNVSAGGNILGGSFYVEKGVGAIFAGGSISTGNQQVSQQANLNTILALGDAQINVTARNSVTIETAYNPTMTLQNDVNAPGASNATSQYALTVIPQFSDFSTYSNNSAVNLTAIAGDVLMTHNVPALAAVNDNILDITFNNQPYSALYNFQPPTLNAVALTGNVVSTSGFALAGAPNGQLNMLAGNSVLLSGTPIIQQDIPLANFSPYYAPRYLNLDDSADGGLLPAVGSVNAGVSDILAHVEGGLHTFDTQPDRIVALNGSVVGDDTQLVSLILPKVTQISAGQNIQDLGFIIQNNNASDVTTETAGNNIFDTTVVPSASNPSLNPVQHWIEGPGRIDISAGNNFDLGDSTGVETFGNIYNPYLPVGGASINIQAGSTSVNYAAFADNYVTAANLNAADQVAMQTYVSSINPAAATSVDAAWTAFKTLPAATQAAFLDTIKPDLNAIFFSDLVTSSTIKGLNLFDGIIASLYSNVNPNGGNINIFGSELETEQGGSIYMFAPGGSVYAGLNTIPSYLSTDKTPATLGVFTVGGGAIGALVHTNFEVDQGRVFTLAGGDITLVSQYGDLSAGEGTKTASSAPPPRLTTNQLGVVSLDISGSIAGSGIATLKTDPDVPDANIYVIAPRGSFDAGDAGVRSSGSVEVNALVVLNAGNIVASGTITGVPTVESNNIGAAVPTNATPSSSDIAKNIANAAANTDNTSTTLSVDVMGFGGTDCKDGKDGCGDDKAKSGIKGQTGTSN
jgi:filamentous hemagglutinin family protein